jgi:hypothetical protein
MLVTYSTWGLQWWEQFGPNESYYFGITDLNGNPVEPNACVELRDHFTSHVWGNPYNAPYPGYYWILTDQIPVSDYYAYPYNFNPNNYPAWTNYLDFDLFTSFATTPGYDEYLCSDELNFYLSKMIEIADVIIPQQNNITITPTHRCFNVVVGCGWSYCGPPQPQYLIEIDQWYLLQYGNRVNRPVPKEDF